MNKKLYFSLIAALLIFFTACEEKSQTGKTKKSDKDVYDVTQSEANSFWKNATIYFMLTDRFYNGNPDNDANFDRKQDGGLLRDFQGGDLKGITQKINEGYFNDLGVDAIWMTPFWEQIHAGTDEGWGKSYAFHGYWARDWTVPDPNFGTEAELAELVEAAHSKGIRVVMDVVMNHTGPVTQLDPVWPDDWVRTGPKCVYDNYKNTVECTLVENLPDIRTDSDEEVDLPPMLKSKWEKEGRLEKEMKELDAFFKKTGYPRAPRYYIMKWVADWVRKLGIDAYRIDTAKHTEEELWADLKKVSVKALRNWKKKNPDKKMDDMDLYMFGEVYGYGLQGGRDFDFGDKKVDFFDYGFESLINFSFKVDAGKSMDTLFQEYSDHLNGPLNGKSVINYISSHDDSQPWDLKREHPLEAGTKLLLAPGSAQIYYGDELARPLEVEGTKGDAHLRSNMNWEDLENDADKGGVGTKAILAHWQKLGKFRQAHPAVGAGVHMEISKEPFVFTRSLADGEDSDVVIVGIGMAAGAKSLPASELFAEGSKVKDYYSGAEATVTDGKVEIDSPFDMVLLGAP